MPDPESHDYVLYRTPASSRSRPGPGLFHSRHPSLEQAATAAVGGWDWQGWATWYSLPHMVTRRPAPARPGARPAVPPGWVIAGPWAGRALASLIPAGALAERVWSPNDTEIWFAVFGGLGPRVPVPDDRLRFVELIAGLICAWHGTGPLTAADLWSAVTSAWESCTGSPVRPDIALRLTTRLETWLARAGLTCTAAPGLPGTGASPALPARPPGAAGTTTGNGDFHA